MKVELLPANIDDESEMRVFGSLYRDYVAELSEFSDNLKAKPVTKNELLRICYNRSLEKYFVLANDQIVGFLLLGVNKNKHEASDWFIGEFYIKKSHQEQKIGQSVIQKMLENQKGRYCLFILNKNKRAKYFWDKVFTECGYRDVSSDYFCDCVPDDCIFRMYGPCGKRN